MATGRVLKNLLRMSVLATAVLITAPAHADHRYLGESHDYDHRDGWGRGHDWDDDDWHPRHRWGGYEHHWHGRGWGHYPPAYYYAPPRYYAPRYRYRGCDHDTYRRGGLVEFLVDYSRYDD